MQNGVIDVDKGNDDDENAHNVVVAVVVVDLMERSFPLLWMLRLPMKSVTSSGKVFCSSRASVFVCVRLNR